MPNPKLRSTGAVIAMEALSSKSLMLMRALYHTLTIDTIVTALLYAGRVLGVTSKPGDIPSSAPTLY